MHLTPTVPLGQHFLPFLLCGPAPLWMLRLCVLPLPRLSRGPPTRQLTVLPVWILSLPHNVSCACGKGMSRVPPWWGLPACLSTLVPGEGVQTEKVDVVVV